MAKPNYRQQKRQKELSRKSRQAERLQRRTGKLDGDEQAAEAGSVEAGVVTPAVPVSETPQAQAGQTLKGTP